MIKLINFERRKIIELLALFDGIFGRNSQPKVVKEVLNLLNLSMRRIISILETETTPEMMDAQLEELGNQLNDYVRSSSEEAEIPNFIQKFLDLFQTYYKFVDRNQQLVLELSNVFRIITDVYLRTDPKDEKRKKEIRRGINELVDDWLAGHIKPPMTSQELLEREGAEEDGEEIEILHPLDLPQYETLLVENAKGVVTIQLNRPDTRNAINHQMMRELASCFQILKRLSQVRMILLTGKGKSFCAGADLTEMKEMTKGNQDWSSSFAGVLRQIMEFPKPVVAVVNGTVMGGGLGLMCVADIILASDQVTFAFPEVHLGIVPAIISPFVIQRLGVAQARRLMLTGEHFRAEQAKTWGLVNEICPPEDLMALQQSMVKKLLKGGPEAQGACKALLGYLPSHTLEENLAYAVNLLNELRRGLEAKEGMEAFLQKRSPSWQEDPKAS